MEDNERSTVVLRYRDGHALRCTLLEEFQPSDRVVVAETEDGETINVDVDALKAVFFLKDPLRREYEIQTGHVTIPPAGGAPSRVEFTDGEVIHGRMASYRVDDNGFFLYPASLDSNNERIFVVARALRTLSIEG